MTLTDVKIKKSQANANGQQQKQNNPENPKPCPPELIGTPKYYEFRKQDFERRNPGKEAPDYYENYGKKYAERFEKLKPELSEKGKKWVDNTMINLQKAMEEGIVESENGASLERDPEAFKTFAYNTHAESYKKAGIAGLSISELKKIGLTPDPKDLFTKDRVKQVCEIGLHVSWQWIKDFTGLITDSRYRIPKTFTSPIIPY